MRPLLSVGTLPTRVPVGLHCRLLLNFLRFANLSRLIATSPVTTSGSDRVTEPCPEASLSRVYTRLDSSDSPSNWTLKMIPF